MNKLTVTMALLLAFIVALLTAGCGGSTTTLPKPEDGVRLFSFVSDDGLETQQISRVNGPYYLYKQDGGYTVTAIYGNGSDSSVQIKMIWPNGDIYPNVRDIRISDIGEYHFQAMKNGSPIGEDVRLDVLDPGQKEKIEAYVRTKRQVLINGKQITIVTCTTKNTDVVPRDIGVTIERLNGPVVDFQIGAAGTWAFSGNQGLLDPGQEYSTGHATMWRSSTGQTINIGDEINSYQYYATLTPDETMVFTTWFTKP